jgi:hypothetical protein
MKIMTPWKMWKLKRFVTQYLKLNELKVRRMDNNRVNLAQPQYFCKCGTTVEVLKNHLMFAYWGVGVFYYIAVCPTCKTAHLHSKVEVEDLE